MRAVSPNLISKLLANNGFFDFNIYLQSIFQQNRLYFMVCSDDWKVLLVMEIMCDKATAIKYPISHPPPALILANRSLENTNALYMGKIRIQIFTTMYQKTRLVFLFFDVPQQQPFLLCYIDLFKQHIKGCLVLLQTANIKNKQGRQCNKSVGGAVFLLLCL